MAPLEHLAPELQAAGEALRQAELQLRETASELRSFLLSLEAEPGRLEQVEAELERLGDLRRRYGAQTLAELVKRGEAARAELAALDDGHDPVEAAAAELAAAEREVARLHAQLRPGARPPRTGSQPPSPRSWPGSASATASSGSKCSDREPGASGADEVSFLIRPNAGLPFGPVAETASGGELSRIALAIAAVAGGETMVFDEIDAGIGGTTAHAVAGTLRRLAERAQVVTITHLPQIATLPTCISRSRRPSATRRRLRSQRSTTRSGATSSSGCSAAPSSSRRSNAEPESPRLQRPSRATQRRTAVSHREAVQGYAKREGPTEGRGIPTGRAVLVYLLPRALRRARRFAVGAVTVPSAQLASNDTSASITP